ncbi:hypothetical protein [Flavobacterium beibuense]|uniref:Lipoprotein n=1 Tax=Flavobacterium beibuense TaxID=657326 RepID=A0A444W974_9FLAO|nr:hypothetical protein [Flavobacterium beibuense]RYJ42439.1 hypothetical protein NU09_2225 [Flavobacterium beibuense]
MKYNYKKNVLVKLFYIVCVISLVSCRDEESSNYDLKILSRGPGTCVNLLLYNKSGEGKLIRGRTKDFYKSDFNGFDRIDIDTVFKIKFVEDLNAINKKLDSIEGIDLVTGKFAHDGKHTEIYINNQKKIDVYGFRNEELTYFYLKFFNSLPYDINTFCESDQLD